MAYADNGASAIFGGAILTTLAAWLVIGMAIAAPVTFYFARTAKDANTSGEARVRRGIAAGVFALWVTLLPGSLSYWFPGLLTVMFR
jgi:hypothetical protein